MGCPKRAAFFYLRKYLHYGRAVLLKRHEVMQKAGAKAMPDIKIGDKQINVCRQ